MFSRFARIMALILSVAVILSCQTVSADSADTSTQEALPIQLGANEDTSDEWRTNYEKALENDTVILYADMKFGHIAFQNKSTGKIWYSVPRDFLTDTKTFGDKRSDVFSEVVVEYLNVSTESNTENAISINSQSDCVYNQSSGMDVIDVKVKKNSLRVEYTFPTIGTVIPIEYTLCEDGFQVDILLNKIECDDDTILVSISVLPSLGAGSEADTGYMVVPDGSGAIVDFNNQTFTKSTYKKTVYGDELNIEKDIEKVNSQVVNMPVFGIKNGNEALFAIVTNGDGMSTLNVQNGHAEMGFNRIWMQADMSVLSNVILYEDDWQNRAKLTKASRVPSKLKRYSVKYKMLEGEDADYVGMAKTYREYLIEEKGMERVEIDNSLALTLYGAADKEAYAFGIPYTSITPLTTFKQAESFIKKLKKNGIDNITVKYDGWSNSGIFNLKIPKNMKALGILGGNSDLKDFQEYCESNNINLYLDVDFTRYRKSGNGYSKGKDAIQTAFGNPSVQNVFLRSVYSPNTSFGEYRLLGLENVTEAATKLLKKSKGIDGISFNTLGQYYYSDLSESNGIYRSETVGIYEDILKSYKNADKNLVFYNANAYTFAYADSIFSVPTASSQNKIFDRDIPFYQLVLRGYVNISTPNISSQIDKRYLLLKAAETGSNIAFDGMAEDASVISATAYDYLYSTTFDLWSDIAIELYKEIAPLLEKLGDSTIKAHYTIGDAAKTVFENGVIVYVNYGDSEATIDGVKLEGKQFKVA